MRLIEALREAWQGRGNSTKVTPDTALSYPAIWYAVNRICGHVGQLPLVLHRRLERGAETASDHPAFRLLKLSPNDWQTPVIFKELLQCDALLWGNAYAYIVRDKRSNPVALLPLYPGRTAPMMVQGVKKYAHIPNEGEDDPILQHKQRDENRIITLNDDEVLHIPGLGFDGIAGKALWKVASESWGIGLSSDKTIKNGFDRGFKSALFLQAPQGTFQKEADGREFINEFNKYHTGSENSAKAGLLRNGVTANAITMNSHDAQMVEHRNYQRQDTALWFLLESILGDDSSVSYNSLEQKHLAYLSNCLMRWLVKWEEECNRKLLNENERTANSHFFKFNVAALLRADQKTTMETLCLGITSRINSPNEAREKLDLNPYEGGDAYENPAITPGQSGGDDASNSAMRSRVGHLIGVETRRVTAATTSANYCDWLDSFYAKWTEKLADAIEELGGDRAAAETHCRESKRLLLECAGQASTKDELAAVVGECVANWACRVDGMVNKLETCGV